jgi:hypothetical protein
VDLVEKFQGCSVYTTAAAAGAQCGEDLLETGNCHDPPSEPNRMGLIYQGIHITLLKDLVSNNMHYYSSWSSRQQLGRATCLTNYTGMCNLSH